MDAVLSNYFTKLNKALKRVANAKIFVVNVFPAFSSTNRKLEKVHEGGTYKTKFSDVNQITISKKHTGTYRDKGNEIHFEYTWSLNFSSFLFLKLCQIESSHPKRRTHLKAVESVKTCQKVASSI